MQRRLTITLAIVAICAAWVFASPLIGLSKLANAVAEMNAAALAERIDFTRLGRSLAPQIVWAYLSKTGRANTLGRTVSSLIAGSSASLADPILGDMLNPDAMLKLLDTGQPGGKLQLDGAVPVLPRGNVASSWQAFQSAEYGIGNFHIRVPVMAEAADQYRLHLQLLQWNWKLVGIDLPEKVKDQLADELIRRIGK